MTPDEEQLKQIPRLPAEVAAVSSIANSVDTGAQEAKFFAKGLSEDEIKRRAANNEHDRNEKFKDHFERIAIAGMWIVSAIFLVVGITWFWHLLTPDCWHWLSPEGVSKIQNIVTGGVLTSVGLGHIKKRMS